MDQNVSDDDLTGVLDIYITEEDGITPISNSTIEIANTGTPNKVIFQETSDQYGRILNIRLDAPPNEYSQTPSDNQPYSEYNLRVTHPGYDTVYVTSVQIYSASIGVQNIRMIPNPTNRETYNPTVIPGHTLFEYYPPKIAEASIKPLQETGEIVLNQIVVPETIVVHDGVPTDSTATNYYVPYLDYIKNVASSEIYSTWSSATILANILAIMSFTLNRVYTEWYRNKGYNFTITSSTAYDHKWIYGQTIYESISELVDSVYNNYIGKPGVRQPILTQYCDGKRVNCPNWMSQWGSKYLGDDGFTAIDILRYYYGSDIFIGSANIVAGIPSSYPGYELTMGTSGDAVLTIQRQLNRIRQNYPAIPSVIEDGVYGTNTFNAVSTFQEIFGLNRTGVVDFPTWYKISQIYVGVTKIAELT